MHTVFEDKGTAGRGRGPKPKLRGGLQVQGRCGLGIRVLRVLRGLRDRLLLDQNPVVGATRLLQGPREGPRSEVQVLHGLGKGIDIHSRAVRAITHPDTQQASPQDDQASLQGDAGPNQKEPP